MCYYLLFNLFELLLYIYNIYYILLLFIYMISMTE